MFLGIDHGTTAIRFANEVGSCYEISRRVAARLPSQQILFRVAENLGSDQVDLVALSYSMGDGLTSIVRLEDAANRGLISQDGAGLHQGGGTQVFEAIRASGWPAVLLPGIHRASRIDPRFRVFSHGMSPEKVGLAYGVFRQGCASFIVCDASSNTVSFAVLEGRIVAAIDAPIFAPGLLQGPLDVQAIRDVDEGKLTANQAFNWGGILSKMGRKGLDQCSPEERHLATESLALFAAMEISALLLLCRDLGQEDVQLFLAGSPAKEIEPRVSALLGKRVRPLKGSAAAQGCAWIAEDVFAGEKSILGIAVDERVQRGREC